MKIISSIKKVRRARRIKNALKIKRAEDSFRRVLKAQQDAEILVRNSIYACENLEQFVSAHNLLELSKCYVPEDRYKALKSDFEYKLKSKNVNFESIIGNDIEPEYEPKLLRHAR